MDQKQYWDEKALDFPRYDKKNQEFQQKVINILKDENMLNKNSSILDVGCGTGVYTLTMAKEVKNILALDISSKMLEFLKEDAWNHNLNKKIETKCIKWQEFESKEKYDLVFASLSAAFSNDNDFEKVHNFAKSSVCFIDFVDTKGSNFEELLEQKYNLEKYIYDDLNNLKTWLKNKNINYKSIPLTNTHSEFLDMDVAITKIKRVLESSKKDLQLSDEEIISLLKPITVEDKVQHILNMDLELIYWQI